MFKLTQQKTCQLCGKPLQDDLLQNMVGSNHCAIHLVVNMGELKLSGGMSDLDD